MSALERWLGNGQAKAENVDFHSRQRLPDLEEPEPPIREIGDEPPELLEANAYAWPEPPAPEAYHGLTGEIVRALEPQTEADPVALLLQILVAFGNVIGRQAHFRVESDLHYLNLFGVVAGETSKARKGTSWDARDGFSNESKANGSGVASSEGFPAAKDLSGTLGMQSSPRKRSRIKGGLQQFRTMRPIPARQINGYSFTSRNLRSCSNK
jgi:hypothetical protein